MGNVVASRYADSHMTLTGIDILLRDGLGDLEGVPFGLLTGSGGVTDRLDATHSVLYRQPRARVLSLFSAEHGIRGEFAAGEYVTSTVDPETGLPVYSLYGSTRRPSEEMLTGLEAIIVDLPGTGLRYTTYPATVRAVLQAAAHHRLRVLVLDRPNPLNGTLLEGPIASPRFRSYFGAAAVPVRHGLTVGELTAWINQHDSIGAELQVVRMEGWRRSMWFDATDLPWVPPSPELPTLAACLASTATYLIEGTNLSEGRGTAQPYELIGAPWVDPLALAAGLNARALPGVRFRPTWFRPATSKHADQTCGGVQIHVTDRKIFQGVRTGLHILAVLLWLYPEHVTWSGGESNQPFLDLLLGSDTPRLALERGDDMDRLADTWSDALSAFRVARRPFLLYPGR